MGILEGRTHMNKSMMCSEKTEKGAHDRVQDVYSVVAGRLGLHLGDLDAQHIF